MPNGHGGKRNNAGKKPWNHPSRRMSNQPVLGSYFQNNNNNNNSTPTQTRGRSLPPTRRNNNMNSTARTSRARSSSSPPTNQSASRSGTTSISSVTPTPTQNTTTTSGARASAETIRIQEQSTERNNPPNNDVDDTVDESLFHRGKIISKSINLRSQKEALTNNSAYYNKAYKNVQEKGILWEKPPDMIVQPYPLKDCWMRFFKLRVFHWIPDAMLGKHWKPVCPCCKKNLTRWGHQVEPRLVFDQHENYWLYAPDRYYCSTCATYNSSIKDTNEKKRHTIYYSTSKAIMDQIEAINPELIDLFPCNLSSKNAIDKNLMNIIIHCAVKGIGPSAMAENISAWHELHWQKLEKQWARYVIKWLAQPAPNQLPPIRRDEIQKCPFYFSEELGGCTPSGKWLIHMFCVVIGKLRKYLDSECLKRAKATLILAIDASYKVPKWMLKWGGACRIYDALISGTNEYNEVPMQFFATSDNHEELGYVLELLSSLGLNPKICFSDDPARDESLLRKYFKDLPQGNDTLDEVVPANLTKFQTPKRILYLFRFENAKLGLSQFRNDIEEALSNTTQTSVKIAFDTGKYYMITLFFILSFVNILTFYFYRT